MVFALFELSEQKTVGFLHIQLKNCKQQYVFWDFYATGRSPSNHRWEGDHQPGAEMVDSRRHYLILSRRLLRQIWSIEKSVLYHTRKIIQKWLSHIEPPFRD